MPLLEFHKYAIKQFENCQQETDRAIIESFKKIKIKNSQIDLTDTGLKTPTATWTYLINDNPFENTLGVKLMGNLGLSVAAGIWGPLMILYSVFKKQERKK